MSFLEKYLSFEGRASLIFFCHGSTLLLSDFIDFKGSFVTTFESAFCSLLN